MKDNGLVCYFVFWSEEMTREFPLSKSDDLVYDSLWPIIFPRDYLDKYLKFHEYWIKKGRPQTLELSQELELGWWYCLGLWTWTYVHQDGILTKVHENRVKHVQKVIKYKLGKIIVKFLLKIYVKISLLANWNNAV